MIRMPAMPRDLTDEVAALAGEIREQLAFYRELGITHLGGSQPLQVSRADREEPISVAATTRVAGQPDRTRAIQESQGPEGTIEPALSQVNLFGEIVSSVESAKEMKMKTSNASTSGSTEVWNDGSLEEIRSDLGQCTRCRLHEHRTTIVFGEGNPAAELVFVGEGPGADEDRTGRPFVGKAGKLLDKIIEAMGMRRNDVYIANVVKCRPPENRTPERDEAATCGPFLFRQLGFIRPKVIVALGAPALQCLTGSREGITRVRGHWQEWHGIKVMPTYHPAYLLRVPDKKKETWEDMKRVRDYIVNG